MISGFRIATVRGIPIRVDITFLVVLPLIAYAFGRAFIQAASLAGVPPQELFGSPSMAGAFFARR